MGKVSKPKDPKGRGLLQNLLLPLYFGGNVSILPSKVMPYLLRLAAPLMDSLIVQLDWILLKGKTFEEYSNSNLVYIFEILAMRGDYKVENNKNQYTY